MKYQYKVVNMNAEVDKLRNNTKTSDGGEVLFLDIINKICADGWRWVNPGNPSEAYFEKVT